MTGKTSAKAPGAKASKANTSTITDDGTQSHVNLVAQAALSALIACGTTAKTFAKGGFGEVDLMAAVAIMHEKVDRIPGDPVRFL
jgi:hypothetical protein